MGEFVRSKNDRRRRPALFETLHEPFEAPPQLFIVRDAIFEFGGACHQSPRMGDISPAAARDLRDLV
jgi:hypothetical protein